MSFELRDYQSEALTAIKSSWADGINRPAVVLPTGAGKTVLFAGLIKSSLSDLKKSGKRVLVLAHREELLEQAEAKIKAMVPEAWVAIVKGSRGQKTHQFADVVVASVQTLARPKRRDAVDRIGMVIVDECHRYAAKSYKDVLDHYGCMLPEGTPTVGVTATLTRMDGGLPDVWQSVAYSKKIHWMIKKGYLIAPTAKSIQVPGLNLASTRVTAGDLNTGDLAAALEESAAFDTIADVWLAEASERPTIVFMPNVETCERLRDAYAARGVAAEVISGETTSTDRKAAYARFNARETAVLVSCMVLTEGFDAPLTSCVIIGRPTLNPGLYIQMVGRGLRLHPGKTDCLVLDIAGASLNHNLAGVNDLESDCDSKCDCNCLTCGCGDRCKCGIQKCGCRCIEQHESGGRECQCEPGECTCGCFESDCRCADAGGICECFGAGPDRPEKEEVAAEVLRELTEVDILGAELDKSHYTWLRTSAGIRFLPVGNDAAVFLLPAPGGGGFFQGVVEGFSKNAPVKRLDNGETDGRTAMMALETYAAGAGFQYNNAKARWRRTPASAAQIKMLRGLGVEVPADIRKGDASDLLTSTRASRALDWRFAKYLGPQG